MFELRNLGLVEVRHHVTEVAVLGILDELVETVDEAATHVVPGALRAAELPEVVGDVLNDDADYEHHDERGEAELCAVGPTAPLGGNHDSLYLFFCSSDLVR